MTKYQNLLAGAKGLLGDCVTLLSNTNKDYIIVGGWSPLLLNSTQIKHPGTHDVDLLFSDGKNEGGLDDIFTLFLANGYMVSAKHNFQLLKVINVAGRDFVYNVDFLHSSDNKNKEDMFVDHLKLPVPLEEYKDETYIEMSIKVANSEVLFKEELFEIVEEEFTLPNGKDTKILFPLINETGLIITKTDSVKQPKRKRDAFDIYLAIKQARDYDGLIHRFRNIKKKNASLFNTLYGVKEAMDNYGMVSNILDYVYNDEEKKSENKATVENEIRRFLSDVGLEPTAKSMYNIHI